MKDSAENATVTTAPNSMGGLSESKDFRKKLVHLALPLAFQQFMLALVSTSDAVMLAAVDQTSLSAVALATQVTFVYNLVLAGITIGESMFAAQYWGKGDVPTVGKVLGIALHFSVPTSLVFFLLSLLAPQALMRIFTNDAALVAGGAAYLRTVSAQFLCLGVSQAYLTIMKNTGHATKTMVISSVMVVLNIVLNAILIFGVGGSSETAGTALAGSTFAGDVTKRGLIIPAMGVNGAAFATTITRVVELAWVLVEMARKGSIKTRIGDCLSPDRALLKDYWKHTSPVLANEMTWGIGFTMYSVIMGHLGSDAVAANSLAAVVKNLTVCVCGGIGMGGGIIVGNELGSGNLERAKEYGSRIARLSVISGAVTGLVILALSPVVRSLGTLSEASNRYLMGMLVVCSVNIIGKSVNATTIGGIFCSGGDSKFGFLCDTVTMWCVTVPLGCLAAFVLKWPVLAVYAIISMDEIVKLPVVYRHFKKYTWVKNLTH